MESARLFLRRACVGALLGLLLLISAGSARAATFSQTTSPDFTSGIACTDGLTEPNMSYFRVFDLAMAGVSEVTSVSFNVARAYGSNPNHAVVVRLYQQQSGTFPAGEWTFLAVGNTNVTNGTTGRVSVPFPNVAFDPAKRLIVEVHFPSNGAGGLQMGFNAEGESAPAYVQAGCLGGPPVTVVSLSGNGFVPILVEAGSPVVCGDDLLGGAEQCDDGNLTDGDGCDSNCTITACGNDIVTSGEACDDGNRTDDDGCDSNCTDSECGNGILNAFEQCDDGNAVNGDGCDAGCVLTDCGNGLLTAGEACDDGNEIDGDTCDSNCTVPACGNGIVAGLEACDDDNTTDGDGCSAGCQLEAACGDGVVGAGEACDDGNALGGDGCELDCTVTVDAGVDCGDGQLDAGEACDDGNTTGGDGCEADCTETVVNACGNGVRGGVEQCDDGNKNDGDGCSALCVYEPVSDWGCAAGGAGGAGGALLLLLGVVGLRRRRR